jgi:hypothetical protein
MSSWVNWTFFSTSGPRVPKKGQFTHERVEYNVFLFDEPLKGSKSLKIFKINLTFRFDKLWHLSKSVHTGKNSQILTVSNKNIIYLLLNYPSATRRHGNFAGVHTLLRILLSSAVLINKDYIHRHL